jgi:hypothetical protein
MIAARHHDDVAVLDGDSLVDRAVVGIDSLEGEALRRVQPMVVGFLESRLLSRRRGVVLVRRVAGPVPCRSDDLDDQQAVRGLGLGQDVADKAAVGSLSSRDMRPGSMRRGAPPAFPGALPMASSTRLSAVTA